jgi:hypothetical protein
MHYATNSTPTATHSHEEDLITSNTPSLHSKPGTLTKSRPLEWEVNLSAESGPCLLDFDLFSQEMAKVYADNNRHFMVVIMLMQEYTHRPPESFRTYKNYVKANWR